MKLDNCVVKMEVDTGATVSDVSDHFSREGLTTLSGAPQSLHNCCNANVEYNGQSAQLPLVVVGCSGPTLLGRDWLSQIRLDWHQIHHVHSASLQTVGSVSSCVSRSLGTLQDPS